LELKNEGGNPTKSGQNRDRRIEKRAGSKIVAGVRHDRGPLRYHRSKHPDQPAALLELPVKPVGRDLGGALSMITS